MTLSAAAVRAGTRPRLDHLRAIMVPAGVVQFSRGRNPDAASGTCLDDNARAWIVAMQALTADPDHPFAREIGDTALDFVVRAQRPDGLFHNIADVRGAFVDDVGSEDSIGRALWACGRAVEFGGVPEWSVAARSILARSAPAVERLRANHARAYAVLGLCSALTSRADELPSALRSMLGRALATLSEDLVRDFHAFATDDWSWWTESLTWGNGRLPEAMLAAAVSGGSKRCASVGMRSLEFLAQITQPHGLFVPIGNDGWYVRGGKRARYDQQPIEACAMVDVWLAAYRLGGDYSYLDRARASFEWFLGRNTERLVVAVEETGGCHDGLLRRAVNRNQGAESTLSYLHAGFALDAVLSA